MNLTGTRREIIESPSGRRHAPRKNPTGQYVRKLDWRVTVCGQLAESGWSQGRRYGYVDCLACVRLLERR